MKFDDLYQLVSENNSPTKKFFHGSMIELPVGTILRPNPDYEKIGQTLIFMQF
jgi:hypothetical protein